MTVTTTATGSSQAVAALYQAAYIMSVRKALAYSQSPFVFTPPQGVMGVGNRGSAVSMPMFFDLDFGSSLSQTADITPVALYSALSTITPELYGNAVQLSQKLSLEAFTDVEAAAVDAIGRNAAATREFVARAAAIGGALVLFGGAATTRATVKAVQTTSTSLISYTDFVRAATLMNAAGAPKIEGNGNLSGYAAIISAETQADLGISSAFIIAAEYGANDFLLNGEVGTHVTGTRLVMTPFAKIFRGAAATVGGASALTIKTALVPGSTVFSATTAQSSNAVGDYVLLSNAASSVESTGHDDEAGIEVVKVISGTTGTTGPYGFVGAGVNGGALYAHSTAATARGDVRDVQCTVFVGSESLGMVYSNEDGLGPEGQIILPEVTGILHQFNNVGWKGFWGFGRVAENRLVRVEHGSSFQSIGH